MRPGIQRVDLVFILMHFYSYGCHKPSIRRYKRKEQCLLRVPAVLGNWVGVEGGGNMGHCPGSVY